jgi:O-antigen ligase
MLVGFVAAAVIVPRRDLGALTVVVAASTAAASVIALAQAVGVAPFVFAPIDPERVNGMFFHPNILGAYLAANVLILTAIGLASGKRLVWLLPVILLGLGGLMVTVSRGPIIAVVSGVIIVALLLSRRKPGRLLMFAVLTPLVIAVAIPETPLDEREKLQQRFQSTFQPGAESGRRVIWREAAQEIEHYPLTGIGALTFTDVFRETSTTPGINVQITHAHNVFLEGYLSLGPIGMIGFFWAIFGALRRLLYSSMRRRGDPLINGWSVGLVGAIFSFIVSGMVDFPFWQVEVTAFFFFLIGAAYALGRDAERPEPATS